MSQTALLKHFAEMQSKFMQQMLDTQKQMAASQQAMMTQLTSTTMRSQQPQREVRCYNCNGRGHVARYCDKPKPSGNDQVQAN